MRVVRVCILKIVRTKPNVRVESYSSMRFMNYIETVTCFFFFSLCLSRFSCLPTSNQWKIKSNNCCPSRVIVASGNSILINANLCSVGFFIVNSLKECLWRTSPRIPLTIHKSPVQIYSSIFERTMHYGSGRKVNWKRKREREREKSNETEKDDNAFFARFRCHFEKNKCLKFFLLFIYYYYVWYIFFHSSHRRCLSIDGFDEVSFFFFLLFHQFSCVSRRVASRSLKLFVCHDTMSYSYLWSNVLLSPIKRTFRRLFNFVSVVFLSSSHVHHLIDHMK